MPNSQGQLTASRGAGGLGGGYNGGAAPSSPKSAGPRHGNFSKRRQNHAIYSHKSDPFIEWLKSILKTSFDLDIMSVQIPPQLAQVEELCSEYRVWGEDSRLARIVPDLPLFFTDLKLKEAFLIYNKKYRITQRR